MTQNNDELVATFKMLLLSAHLDTERDETPVGDCMVIGGFQINDDRLGQLLRAVKASTR